VVSFTLQTIYTQYPLDRRLGGPKATLNMVERRKYPSLYWELNLSPPTYSLLTMLTELL